MEKSEMMKKFEAETGKQSAIVKFMAGGQALESKDFPKIGPYEYSTDYIAWLEAQITWRTASEKPERGETVLATYLNSYGKRRRVRAVYVRQYEEELDYDDDSDYEYNEENDTYYLKEGWYELIDNWDTYSSVAIVEGVVDHWLPMPKYAGE
jgi:hypothetical protein